MGETGGLFVIDLETGDLSQFSATSAPGSTVLDAHVDAKNNESYGLRVIGDGSSSYVYGSKTVGDETELYTRCYVYIDSGMTLGSFQEVSILALLDGGTRLCKIMYQNDTGSPGAPESWRVIGQALPNTGSGTNFSLDTWHRVEIHWKAGSGADGGAQVWVDGDSIFNDFSDNLTAYSVDTVRIGADFNDNMSNGNFVYIDDIKAALTGPIGAYSVAGGGIVVLRRRRM